MKKIAVVAAMAAMLCGAAFAQNAKPVAEKDVAIKHVKDFEKQVSEPTNVKWWMIDSLTYKVTFMSKEGNPTAHVYSNRGVEKFFFVENRYCPHAISDTIAHMFPGYTLRELWVRKVRGNKQTYQARVAKMGGFLWWKREKESKKLNFEIDGKFISAE